MNNNTVYIVDDDVELLNALKWLFESINFKAKTYLHAFDFLEQYNPNDRGCLITDVCMPDMSGLELLEKLKTQNSLLNVIIITGFGDIPMAIRAMKAGAIDFIEKPLNEQDLLELIQKCLVHYNVDYSSNFIIDKDKLLTESELQALDLIWKED
ncbi:response regulator transcription factor [Legionella maioricensis]|uniref:Response regulator n=1 Tax=Legionella maioricensis TaxID=2896528 RepID=A0A9X2D2U9_9GAMM|nr:response regulator [Legionella maioricensis]MCL9685539.1 response regulator [Legionella maioricensis]MCL9688901.1 response regulator [Legionella maioricensis]